MWISHPSVCQRVNVGRSVFCQLHVPFLAKPLLTTVNLVLPVTFYIVKSVNSAHHIHRVFPSVHCTTSIHRYFSYWERKNVTSISLRSLSLISSPGTKSHLLPLTTKLNLSPRPSYPPRTLSPPNFQDESYSSKICLFLWLCSMQSYWISQHNTYQFLIFDGHYFIFLSLFKILLTWVAQWFVI